jgi:hypothetical protein
MQAVGQNQLASQATKKDPGGSFLDAKKTGKNTSVGLGISAAAQTQWNKSCWFGRCDQ